MDEDPRKPLSRLSRLLDDGWLAPLHPPDSSNVQTVRGRIGNIDVIAYCTDGSTMGGALGQLGGQRIAAAIDLAVRERCPVIGLWHSGGAQLAEGISSLDGIGRVFAAMIGASGRVPQISVVLGTAAGGIVLNRLSDVDFKRYLRLVLTVIGAVYLVQAVRLYIG